MTISPLNQSKCGLVLAILLLGARFTGAQIEFFILPGTTPETDDPFESQLTNTAIIEDFDSYTNGALVTDFSGVTIVSREAGLAVEGGSIFRSGSFGTPDAFYQNALLPGRSGGYLQTVEFQFSFPVNGFGLWIFDDGGVDNKYRLGIEDERGQIRYSDFLNGTNPTGIQGFIGVHTGFTIITRAWIEAHTLNSTAEAPVLEPSEPFEMDYVKIQPVDVLLSHTGAYREVEAASASFLFPQEGTGPMMAADFQLLPHEPTKEYRVLASINLEQWSELTTASVDPQGVLSASAVLRPDYAGPLFMFPVEYDWMPLEVEDAKKLQARLEANLVELESSMTTALQSDPAFASFAGFPALLRNLVQLSLEEMTEEERRQAMEVFQNSGHLSRLSMAASSSALLPDLGASVPLLAARTAGVETKTPSDPRWDEIRFTRGYLAHERAFRNLEDDNIYLTLYSEYSGKVPVFDTLMSIFINFGNVIQKGMRPSVPTAMRVQVEGGSLDNLVYGEEPYPRVRFFMDFESVSDANSEAFAAIIELANRIEQVAKFNEKLSGDLEQINDAVEAGAALQGISIEETANEYERYLASLKALAPNEIEELLGTVQPLIDELKAIGTATASNVEVDPSYFGIKPILQPIAPAETNAAIWDLATSEIQPKNIRTTGSGKIGFSFTDPLFPKVSLALPTSDYIEYTVPNDPPVFLGADPWTSLAAGKFRTILNFEDRELDTVIVENEGAAYGDLRFDPATSELVYTLNSNAKSLFSWSTSSFTTDLPFTVLSSKETPTSFEAILTFPDGQSDTVSFDFRDKYNEPQNATAEIALSAVVPPSITPSAISLVPDPSLEGSSDPAYTEFLSYAFKSDFLITGTTIRQKFLLLEKAEAIEPAVDVWPLWFKFDIEKFHIPQIINVLPEVGDGIPPEILAVQAGFTYEKDNYNIVLGAVDGKSPIDAWYYRISDSAETVFSDPAAADPNWIELSAPSLELNRSLSLQASDPFFVAPDGYETDWHLHLWCRDAAGNVSQRFVYDLPVAKTYYTDSRDGKRYETIVIAGREWFRENLAYGISSGRLNYNYSEIDQVIPPGWYAPTVSDYVSLMASLGMTANPELADSYIPATTVMDALNLKEDPAGDFEGLPWWTRNASRGVVGWLLTASPTDDPTYPFYYFRFGDDYPGYTRPEDYVGGSVNLGSGMTNATSMALRPWRPAGN